MELKLVTSDIEFQACGPFEARLDKDRVHRKDKESGLPLWAVSLVAWNVGDSGKRQTETILVTVATDNPPSVDQMDFVTVVGLRAIPWVADNGQRAVRIAYRAESVVKVSETLKKTG